MSNSYPCLAGAGGTSGAHTITLGHGTVPPVGFAWPD